MHTLSTTVPELGPTTLSKFSLSKLPTDACADRTLAANVASILVFTTIARWMGQFQVPLVNGVLLGSTANG
jgi:hypothetical protein